MRRRLESFIYWLLLILAIVFLIGMGMGDMASKDSTYPQQYNDEKGIERNLKLVKINDFLVYDNITKIVYWKDNRKRYADLSPYIGKHAHMCKYIDGKIVEYKE